MYDFCILQFSVEAEVSKHEFDPHRFDIRIGDQAFYLRASTPSEREAWVNAIWNTQESDGNELKRCGSLTSLISTTSLGTLANVACTSMKYNMSTCRVQWSSVYSRQGCRGPQLPPDGSRAA